MNRKLSKRVSWALIGLNVACVVFLPFNAMSWLNIGAVIFLLVTM
jgi:hypothetical protein